MYVCIVEAGRYRKRYLLITLLCIVFLFCRRPAEVTQLT